VLLYVLVLPFLCAFSILFFGACGAALIMTGIEAIRDFAF
jgi:hypothetical protein